MLQKNTRFHLRNNQALAYLLSDKVLPHMTETLGSLIRQRMKAVGIKSNSELARLIGKSGAYVGDLVNDSGKTISGTYRPSPEVVKSLAKALQVSELELLRSMDYVTDSKESMSPKTMSEFLASLEAAGIDVSFGTRNRNLDEFSEDELNELRERIAADVGITLKRKSK